MVLAVAVMSSGIHLRRYLNLLHECDAASMSDAIRARRSSRRFVSPDIRIADQQNPCVNQIGAQTATIPMKHQKASYKSKASDNKKALLGPARCL